MESAGPGSDLMLSPTWRGSSLGAMAAALLVAPAAAGAQDSAAATPLPTPAPPVAAEPAAAGGGVPADPAAPLASYTPADFARFAPRSALDLLQQVPDFTISGVSGDRGLGEASENILINGERVSGKSNDARSYLGSIPASAVQRIDIVDGASLNIPGLTGRVANVITSAGAWRYQFQWYAVERRNLPTMLTRGVFSASGRIGASDVTISLNNDEAFRRGGVGPERVFDGTGNLVLRRFERQFFIGDYPRLIGTLRRQWADGTVLNLNLSGAIYRFRAGADGDVVRVATGALSDERFRSREDEWNVEGGGDVAFDLGGGRLKLIGYGRFEHSPIDSIFTATPRAVGGTAVGSRFDRTIDDGEGVVRGEYGWRSGGADWLLSIEGAYNFLDNRSSLGLLQPDGSFLPIAFDGANVFVDEWRSEVLLTRGWTLARGLTAQITGGGEYSRLRQAGPGGLVRSFWRPKGTLRLTWTPGPGWTVNGELRRAVGQLSFFDFASRVDLQNNNASTGNRELVPEQSWRARAQVTRQLGRAGSLTVGGFHEWITDIVDQIPITATTEGVGNLPRARRWGATASGTLNFEVIGAAGARLNFAGEVRNSRLRDPLTGIARPISEDLEFSYSADFRYDIPGTDLAWGAEVSRDRARRLFRLDEVSSNWFNRPFASVYAEHKDVGGLTMRLTLRNILNGSDDIRRDIFVARRDGPLLAAERQERRLYPWVVFSISGSF